MASQDIVREQAAGGDLKLSAGACTSTFGRIRPGGRFESHGVGVGIAQHLSQTGNLVQIYTDRELFDARLAAALDLPNS